jgi:glyoxylase-like metal-dependent hydrolase (beta-lactamase superfamily II)
VSALPQLRRYPEGLLRAAYTRPETLRWIGESTFEGRKQEVIAFADADGVSVDLSFDAQTHLLTKSETLRADPLLGDGAVEIVFSDYRPVGAVKLPFRYTERQAGATLQQLTAASLTSDSAAADAFSPPSDYTRVEPKPPDPVVKLAENVYAIMGDYNSVAIAFPDHIVVLEEAQNGRSAQNAIDLIRKTIGKSIRYVIATHFHFDHLGGIRTYIAGRATVVTTASAKHVLESRGLTAKHTIRPDRLAQNPSTADDRVVDKRRVFEGGGMRLEVIDIGPSPHVKEMLIGYLPAQKVLFQADLLDLPPDAETPVAGDDTRDLAAKIERLGLDVRRIVWCTVAWGR